MNLESRKERKEKKDTPMKEHFYFIVITNYSFQIYYFSNHSRPSGDQTSTFTGPGHFLIATSDCATAKF